MPPTAHRSRRRRWQRPLLLAALGWVGFALAGSLDAARAQLYAYVLEPEGTTQSSATVDVVDLATQAVTRIALGGDTFSGAVSPNNALFFVRDFTDAEVTNQPLYALTVVDTGRRSLQSVLPLESDGGVAVAPDAPVAYLTECTPAGVVAVVDFTSGETLDEIPLDVNPQNIWLAPSGATAYVTDGGHCPGTGLTDDSIAAVDTATRREVARIPLGGVPRVATIAPRGDAVYVTKTAHLVDTSIAVIDTASNAVTGEIPVDNPGVMAIAPDGARLYVISYPDAGAPKVSVIDTAAKQAAGAIGFQPLDSPAGVAIHPGGQTLYVTYRSEAGASYIAEVDTATETITATVPIPYAGSIALVNSCPADCHADGRVTVDEIIASVDIAFGRAPLSTCPTIDANGDGRVTVDELVQAVGIALNGCPAQPPAGPAARNFRSPRASLS